MLPSFQLESPFKPEGDQPQAIEKLVQGYQAGRKHQVLLGVTGSGKTFTMANVVAQLGKPTLVIAHNKTLAAQLYSEFKEFFPNNAIEYFVSYYDYYQPEAYLPSTDTYIGKETMLNEELNKLRHSATQALFERRDVLIVASVSCIYGLGSPEVYHGMLVYFEEKMPISIRETLRKLVEIQYSRHDLDLQRGTFRVRGDTLEIFPSHADSAIRIELFGEEIEAIHEIDPLTGKILQKHHHISIYPNTHYATPLNQLQEGIKRIRKELIEWSAKLRQEGKLLEAQRITQRTNFDLEMMLEIGYCTGIENYSRHLADRKEGEPPPTLIDYFPRDALLIIDESHATVPQLRGMYRGDRSRKKTLVEYGFRMPSALDNRPLQFEEFEKCMPPTIYVSATPAAYELEQAKAEFESQTFPEKAKYFVAEQIIRPTGLIDPEIIIKPAKNQVDDLIGEINETVEQGDRVLVTTLTKRMAEDLTDYLKEMDIKVRYLHSEIDTIERTEIIRQLRLHKFDVLVGINLLREGLDIPEVALVAVLDADKEGFLRSATSLIQTSGRAARNVRGRVIMYADHITGSIKAAINETNRRRASQMRYNQEHKITPQSVEKSVREGLAPIYEADYSTVSVDSKDETRLTEEEIQELIEKLRKEMFLAASGLDFEKAAQIRDQIQAYEDRFLNLKPKKKFRKRSSYKSYIKS